MTIEEFRNHKYLPGEWRNLLRTNSILQRVLQVMEENHPARFTVLSDKDGDLSPTRAALELGVTKGYSRYGDTLLHLAKPTMMARQIGEPTYEKEEHETQAQGQG